MSTPTGRNGFDVTEMSLPMLQPEEGCAFYRSAMEVLQARELPFLVGGAYAMRVHADVHRDTKDFDLFIRPQHTEKAIAAFREAGFCAGYVFSHWLAKVHGEGRFTDIIFRAGNGLCDVDDEWFAFAKKTEIFGLPVAFCPPEEMMWQKSYIMERERFDGADVLHLLRSCGHTLDWNRLLRRFGEDWPVLLSHLVLFRFVYPSEHDSIPDWVMQRLAAQLTQPGRGTKHRICRGTLISRLQYLPDIEKWGYADPRAERRVSMSEAEVQQWTQEAVEQASFALP